MVVASLAIFMLISPVAACSVSIISNTCEPVVCPDCTTTCTVVVQFQKENWAYSATVTDTLPATATIVSSDPAVSPLTNPIAWTVTVPKKSGPTDTNYLTKTFTVTINPPLNTAFTTKAKASNVYGSSDYETSIRMTAQPCPEEAPEFPTIFFPAILIIGFLGSVLYIRRNQEN